MRIVAIIQARMGSSRLPGKSLMPLRGKPLLAHVIERVRAVRGLTAVVLATTVEPKDDPLVSVAEAARVAVWRGSERDVLGRMHDVAQWVTADAVMRVTADCPLFAPDIAERALGLFQFDTEAHYVWNDTARSGWPDGTDVEVFPVALLRAADLLTRERSRDEHEENKRLVAREHVTPMVRASARRLTVLPAACDLSRLKLSVDRQCELERVADVMSHLRQGDILWADTVRALYRCGLISLEEANTCLN